MSPTHDHPWEYPDCPKCETNVYVIGWNRGPRGNARAEDPDDYKCEFCGTTFDVTGGRIAGL